MVNIEPITNNWDRENRDIIQRNFDKLARQKYEIMKDFLDADPSKLNAKLNGKLRADMGTTSNLNNFGINFDAEVNGVIWRAWVYADQAGKVLFGLAEQEVNRVASAELKVIEVDLNVGWNHVTLNFPVEQNKSYTIFRRNIGDEISLSRTTIRPWNTHPFLSEGLVFRGGKYLDEQGSYAAYSPFYEIELVTSPAQIYKIANDSVKPERQFYVGNNPPIDTQFWFKPVGDE